MNKIRRKEVAKVVDLLTDLKEKLELILDEEQETYDNIPENLQDSDRAVASEEAIEIMEEAGCSIEEAIEKLEEVAYS